jgi:hypothetical protein
VDQIDQHAGICHDDTDGGQGGTPSSSDFNGRRRFFGEQAVFS